MKTFLTLLMMLILPKFPEFLRLKLPTTKWRSPSACLSSPASWPSASSWTASSPPSPRKTPGRSSTPWSCPGGTLHPSGSSRSLTSSEPASRFRLKLLFQGEDRNGRERSQLWTFRSKLNQNNCFEGQIHAFCVSVDVEEISFCCPNFHFTKFNQKLLMFWLFENQNFLIL